MCVQSGADVAEPGFAGTDGLGERLAVGGGGGGIGEEVAATGGVMGGRVGFAAGARVTGLDDGRGRFCALGTAEAVGGAWVSAAEPTDSLDGATAG
jgi:hypothetical protein